MGQVNRLYKIKRTTDGLFSCGGTSPAFTRDGNSWDSTKKIINHLKLFRRASNRDIYADCVIVSYDLIPAAEEPLSIDKTFHGYEAEEIAAKLRGDRYW